MRIARSELHTDLTEPAAQLVLLLPMSHVDLQAFSRAPNAVPGWAAMSRMGQTLPHAGSLRYART